MAGCVENRNEGKFGIMTEPLPFLQQTRAAYHAYITRVYRDDFGVRDPEQVEKVCENWFQIDERHDDRFAVLRQRVPHACRVLDLASGMGTAALRGLTLGFDVRGIEPDAEKLGLMRRRLTLGDLETDQGAPLDEHAAARFIRAVGERLPYRDQTFDAVLSYQTLEHVQDVEMVLAEMLRVVKPGGALHLRCPDYRGTFEGHYLVPWLPLMPRTLARAYLYARGRPANGFAAIVYVTRRRLRRALHAAAARAGHEVDIVDLERERIRARLASKRLPSSPLFVRLAEAALYVRRAFRAETHVNLWVTKRPFWVCGTEKL